MKKFWKIILILSPVICFLIIWGTSLAKCEFLTLIHGNEFAEAYKTNSMLGDMEYWKVMNYSKERAQVYFVSINHKGADMLTFIKENEEWKLDSWNTIWSTTGSADNTIFPYWWHFFYSHPRL